MAATAPKDPIENAPSMEKGAELLDGNTSSDDGIEGDWTIEEEKQVRHKLDIWIVPLVTLLYLLCFLDRANIGNARIQGMAVELDLNRDYRFNWALSIFYIVYLFVEVPSNIILKRVGPRFYLPFLVVGFGFVSMCTAFVTSFAGLATARAFLGVFEGGAMPGIAFFLSSFYKREELYFRVGIFVSAASMAGAFGGLLAAGLARIPEWGTAARPINTWRNIFFFEGLLTVIVGLLAPWIMATNPAETWFLTPRQRYIAAERLRREHKANPAEKVTMKHIKMTVTSVMNYVCALAFFLINITVQGVSLFMPTILNDLGYTATRAQLFTVPPYVLASAAAIGIAFISDKTRRRGIYLASFTFLCMIGFSILRWLQGDRPSIKYMAIFFVTVGAFPGGPGFLSWGMNNAAGPAVRAVSSGYIVSIGTIGGIVATWSYIPRDGPLYHTGHELNLGGQIATFALASFGMVYCMWENKQREQGKRDHRLNGLSEQEQQDLGYKHPDFRFMI